MGRRLSFTQTPSTTRADDHCDYPTTLASRMVLTAEGPHPRVDLQLNPTGQVPMKCPECSYDLTGSTGSSCPECGTTYSVVASVSLKFPTRLLYVGISLILMFCVAQTVWFWRESSLLNGLIATGGQVDPAELQADVRIALWAKYVSNLCLGIGITCIAVALFHVFRRVALLLASEKAI